MILALTLTAILCLIGAFEILWGFICFEFLERHFDLDFVDIFLIPGIFRVIDKSRHPEKYVIGKPFKINIKGVTKEISVDSNLSKAENLSRANVANLTNVIVNRTKNNYCLIEILTGKKLYCSFNGVSDHCFGYLSSENVVSETPDVSSGMLDDYFTQRLGEYKGYASFKAYLNYLEKRAESYYKKASSK